MAERETEFQLKFTKATTEILNFARLLADGYGHRHIGAEHILLALINHSPTIASRLIYDKAPLLQNAIESLINEGEIRTEELGLTTAAQKLIELAAGEARMANEADVDAHHLLFGAIKTEGFMSGVLESVGIYKQDLPKYREEANKLLKQRNKALQAFALRLVLEQ